jgi:hypothetical protein
MHGQKKRRKRTMEGLIVVDGTSLKWWLVSEPQWTTEDGYIGLRSSKLSQFPLPELCLTAFSARL